MFDFSKMGEAMAALSDLDQVIRALLDEQRATNVLLGMLIAGRDVTIGPNGTLDDRAALAYLAQAREIARGQEGRT